MSPAERQAFEAEMANDPQLQALVQQHRIERIGLELLVEHDLMAKMRAWDRETELLQQLQPTRPRTLSLTWVLRAAAVVATLAVGYWLLRDQPAEPAAPEVVQTQPKPPKQAPTWRKPKQHSTAPTTPPSSDVASTDLPPAPIEEMQPEGPAMDYAAVADAFFQERDFLPPRGSKGGSAEYLRGLRKLQDGQYQDVTSTLRPDWSAAPSVEVVQQQELLAVAYYKNQQYTEAAFRRIAATGAQPYAQRAEWGVVLTLLQQMPQRQAALQPALDIILRQPEHLFHTKAQQLRERLQGAGN